MHIEKFEVAMQELTKRGAFLTTADIDGKFNTMTISWGFIGFMWNKPQFIAVVRPQRYTKEILDNGDSFTVSIPLDDSLKEQLAICGTKSGRDILKEEVVKMIPSKSVASPIIDGCHQYCECKIKLVQPINGEALPKEIADGFYKDDFHIMYVGEVIEWY